MRAASKYYHELLFDKFRPHYGGAPCQRFRNIFRMPQSGPIVKPPIPGRSVTIVNDRKRQLAVINDRVLPVSYHSYYDRLSSCRILSEHDRLLSLFRSFPSFFMTKHGRNTIGMKTAKHDRFRWCTRIYDQFTARNSARTIVSGRLRCS